MIVSIHPQAPPLHVAIPLLPPPQRGSKPDSLLPRCNAPPSPMVTFQDACGRGLHTSVSARHRPTILASAISEGEHAKGQASNRDAPVEWRVTGDAGDGQRSFMMSATWDSTAPYYFDVRLTI